ncbi:reverse transcriptase domain-containing protein [Ilumatobacter sp.]|uniref:reverse transcriptase domain-containing protein n=1 Tax=Ilumatobacter sp. TaxID=1967498 RepID=UPI003751B99B
MTSRLILPGALSEPKQIAEAVRRQCADLPDLLPPDPAAEAVAQLGRVASVTKFVTARIREGLVIESREVLSARKSRTATRPVTPLSFTERVILDHLIQVLADAVEVDELSDESISVPYAGLQQAPIEAEAAWVVGADINSYFQYVDHQTLVDQIIGRTGNWELADSIRSGLGGVMGLDVGLPQGFRPMRLLGDIYLAACIRRLRRAGYQSWAHSDDLRIAVDSERDAHEALQLLDESARSLGLSLNTEKCWVRAADEYAGWSARPDQLLTEFSDAQVLEVSLWLLHSEYEDDEEEDDEEEDDDGPTPEEIRGTVRRVFEWVEGKPPSWGGAEAWSHRVVITEALRKGRNHGEPAGLPVLHAIVAEFPQLTPEVSRYFKATAHMDPETAGLSFRRLVRPTGFVSAWQLAWLAWAAPMQELRSGIAPVFETVAEIWPHDIAGAWAQSVLLDQGRVSVGDLIRSLDRAESPIARNVLLAAIVRGEPTMTNKRRQALASDADERAVVEYAGSQR